MSQTTKRRRHSLSLSGLKHVELIVLGEYSGLRWNEQTVMKSSANCLVCAAVGTDQWMNNG